MKESFKPSPGPPAVPCLTELMQRSVNRRADWHKVLLQPQSGHLTPAVRVSAPFHRGVKIPISWFGLIHVCLDPMEPRWSQMLTWTNDRSVHCVRREEMYQGRSRGFLGMESLIGGPAAEPPRLHINTFQA